MKLCTSCTLQFLRKRASQNITEYYHVYTYLIVQKYEIELLLSAINARNTNAFIGHFIFL